MIFPPYQTTCFFIPLVAPCTPLLTFGKFEERDEKTIIPLSAYCNHAVNDGYHCAMLFQEFQQRADGLE